MAEKRRGTERSNSVHLARRSFEISMDRDSLAREEFNVGLLPPRRKVPVAPLAKIALLRGNFPMPMRQAGLDRPHYFGHDGDMKAVEVHHAVEAHPLFDGFRELEVENSLEGLHSSRWTRKTRGHHQPFEAPEFGYRKGGVPYGIWVHPEVVKAGPEVKFGKILCRADLAYDREELGEESRE
ncbi:hypothetical protein BDZ91DRAFT_761337 [Kalaharituber pfeilii]|nr:hypothetical protein BDZ91DRAFT_761337 [Kalaharituber pfeilii]